MRNLDEQELLIVKELIRNPRSSDNAVSKRSKVPVMTVNRKRKKLEEEGLLMYFTRLSIGEDGTKMYHARQLYIIKFKIGITRKLFLEKILEDPKLREFNAEHINESYLGEKDGHLALIMLVESETEPELVENFNGELIPMLKNNFGKDSIVEIITSKVTIPIRLHHNYMPLVNMEKGRIKQDWLEEWIFVDKESFRRKKGSQKTLM